MKCIYSFLIAAIIVTATLGIFPIMAGKASAQTPSVTTMHYGWAGYSKNDTIYMDRYLTIDGINQDNLSSSAYVLPEVSATSNYSWHSSSLGLIKASAGIISSGTGNFYEHYSQLRSPAPSLVVQVPFALSGGLKVKSTSAISANSSGAIGLNASLSEKNSYGLKLIRMGNDTVLNATGMNGEAGNANLLKLILDAASLGLLFVPGLDAIELAYLGAIALGTTSVMLDFTSLASTSAVSPSPLYNNATVYEDYGTTGGNFLFENVNNETWQDVYAMGTNFQITIPAGDFNTTHYFSLEGQFQLGGSTIINDYYNFSAVPAVEITGHVHTASGANAPNAYVYLDHNGNAYRVETNQYGQYRFFARPDESYSVWGRYQTPFSESGNSSVVTVPTGSYGGLKWANLTIPATLVNGTVRDHNGNPIENATVTISKQGKWMTAQTSTTGSYMFGVPVTGVYTISANASGYNREEANIDISSISQTYYTVNLQSMEGVVNPLPPGILSYYQILITNTQNTPTTNPYDQEVVIDSAAYYNLEAVNLSNVEFFYSNGTVIPSWLESGNYSALNKTVYWLKLGDIPAHSSITVYMGFASPSTILFNGKNVGEAPELSTPYGKYDNGANVFPFYDNFTGKSLGSQWTVSGITYTVDNGFTATAASSSNDGIWSTSYTAGVGTYFDMYTTAFSYGTGWLESGLVTNTNSNNYGTFVQSQLPQQTLQASIVYAQQQDVNGWADATLTDSNVSSFSPGIYTVNPTSSSYSTYQYDYGPAAYVGTDAPSYPLHIGLIKSSGGSFTLPFKVTWIRVRSSLPDGIMPSIYGPVSVAGWIHLAIINSQGVATPNPFQQMIKFNASAYSSYENQGLQNVEFMWINGTIIPSWLESGTSSSTNAIFWLRIPSIPADSGYGIYVVFADRTAVMMNGETIGEAPQLSAVYGQYDNGANVFLWYDNFAGSSSSAPPGWSQWSYASMNNGLYINPPSTDTVNVGVTYNGASFGPYTTTDIYGQPLYPDGNAYSAAWFGYTGGNLLLVGNPSGYTYVSYPKNAPGGTGGKTNYPDAVEIWTISRSGSDGYSYLNYGDSYSASGLPTNNQNVTDSGQGFSNPSFVQWWRVRATPPNNVMPSVVNYGYVTFKESGLSGQSWSVTLSGPLGSQTQSSTGNNITLYGAGNNDYSIGAPGGYTASPSSGSVDLGIYQQSVDISFSTTYITGVFSESGLPSGSTWSATYNGKSGYASAGSSITITVVDSGDYWFIPQVSIRESNGDTYTYSPSPSSGNLPGGGHVSTTFSLTKICSGSVCFNSVNGSTPILLANGSFELADAITPGTQIMAYNWSSGIYTPETILNVSVTTHSRMLTINGYLSLSYNQSVLTDHGYVTAGNLTNGDRVFDAFTGTYVRVNSLSLSYGHFIMYDFEIGGIQDYIAWQYVLYANS